MLQHPFIKSLMDRFWRNAEFIRYASMAAIGLFVHSAVFFAGIYMGIDPLWVNIQAIVLGMLAEFPLHYRISFPNFDGDWRWALLRFITPRPVTAILGQVLFTIFLPPVRLLNAAWGLPDSVVAFAASFFGLVVVFLLNYTWNRAVAFRKVSWKDWRNWNILERK